jgi:ketosteroid isomerase-like protein
MKKTLTSLALATVLGFTTETTALADDMTPTQIKNGYLEHGALAQYHRWYQVYERAEGGIDNALDILAEDVVVTSGLGVAKGHEQYAQRVSQLPQSWKNAHHVRDVQVSINDDGAMALTADITYLNAGLLEDGGIRTADLTYTMALAPTESVLPKFTEITIAQNSDGTSDKFVDAYAENRLRSLVHYWLALIEDPSRNPEPVREILADGFALNFSSGAITDFAGFEAWLAGPGSQVAASTHVISEFSVMENADGTYGMTADFDWAGILPDGSELVAKTRHNWTVTNDVTERFARILTVDVEVLEPFRPRSD